MIDSVQGEISVSLELILNQVDTSNPNGMNNPDLVRVEIASYLKKYQKLTIDLKGTRNMSPSFAYLVFGKLYDLYGDSVLDRIQFINDSLNLKNRIMQALARRSEVIKSEKP